MRKQIIAFEGVDGAGKSTVLALVQKELQARGVRVFLPRSGKEHVSRPARMIRRLARDRRNLELTPRAELALYCAREAQVLDELVRPALARGETVLLDRSLVTPLVLGCFARGLPRADCEAAVRATAGEDLAIQTLIFDVHPRTSRIRKRIEKIRGHTLGTGGRKGLAGSGFKERIREGYLALAREHGWPVFHVERISPAELAARVLRVLDGAPVAELETPEDNQPEWLGPRDWSLQDALEAVPPQVALFLSSGLSYARALRRSWLATEPSLVAWALDSEDPLRRDAAISEPEYALRGWSGRPLDGDDDLRLTLVERAPEAALGALKHVHTPRADELRQALVARAPGAVVSSLVGRQDPLADSLRQQAWKASTPEDQATSLALCGHEQAWKLRERLLEKEPTRAIESLRGTQPERAQPWLERYVDFCPKAVLRALAGRSDEAAYRLREQLFDTGREVIDSLRGLDDPAAWALRERALPRWPSTVLGSLVGLDPTSRWRAVRQRAEELGAGDLHVLRRSQRLDEQDELPEWARFQNRAGQAIHD